MQKKQRKKKGYGLIVRSKASEDTYKRRKREEEEEEEEEEKEGDGDGDGEGEGEGVINERLSHDEESR